MKTKFILFLASIICATFAASQFIKTAFNKGNSTHSNKEEWQEIPFLVED